MTDPKPRACLYFAVEPADGAGRARVRMSTTVHVEKLVQRMARAGRKGKQPIAGIVEVNDLGQARKLRRVLGRHWHRSNTGAGLYDIDHDAIGACLRHFEVAYRLTCFSPTSRLGPSSRRVVFQHFARGSRSRWRGQPDAADFASEKRALDELLATGTVTQHRKRKTGEIEYRGTAKCLPIAHQVAGEQVPKRGQLAPVEQRKPVTEVKVVPEPQMARAELLHQLEAHKDDPADVLQQGYRYAATNMRLLIGALAGMHGLTEAQKQGAGHFRRVADHAQLGGAKAIDYENTKVDTSTINVVVDAGANARAEFHSARKRLGLGTHRLAVIERMVLGDQSIRQVAAGLGYGASGAARARIAELAMDGATELAREFGYAPPERSRMRFEGERPEGTPDDFRTEIAQPDRSPPNSLTRQAKSD